MLTSSEKILYGVSALVIAVGSAFGFYLIDAKPVIKSLVVSGHSHLLLFAYGAVLFGLLLARTGVSEGMKTALSWWMLATFVGPIFLIHAGITGNTSLLATTGPIFEGSFVVLWVLAAYQIFRVR